MTNEKIEDIKIDTLPPTPGGGDDLKSLVEKNIKWSQANYQLNTKINHRITMMVVGSYLRLLLIVLPIILAIIYLPPLLSNMLSQYKGLFSAISSGGNNTLAPQLNDIVSQMSGGDVQKILELIGNKK